jgi:hypothetical protein
MEPNINSQQTTTDKTEDEQQLYIELEVAAHHLWQMAEELFSATEELAEIAAEGGAIPEMCHQIDDRIHAIIQQHSLLLCLAHATEAVSLNNSLAHES